MPRVSDCVVCVVYVCVLCVCVCVVCVCGVDGRPLCLVLLGLHASPVGMCQLHTASPQPAFYL